MSQRIAMRSAYDAIFKELCSFDLGSIRSVGLASGLAGIGLFLAVAARSLGTRAAFAKLEECQEQIQLQLGDAGCADLGLYSGLAGVAFAFESMEAAHLGQGRAHDVNGDIDGIIADGLSGEGEGVPAHFDLVSGTAGLAMYALSRPEPAARDRLYSLAFDRLARSATDAGDEAFWMTTPRYYGLEAHPGRFPTGVANLGVAHGTPGVVGVLAQAVRRELRTEDSVALLRKAGRWLVRHSRVDALEGIPYLAEQCDSTARLAWCYGDPGVALALLDAAVSLGDAELLDQGQRIALRAAARPLENSGVSDCGLCHGSTGLSLLFRRLNTIAPRPELEAANDRWMSHTLSRYATHGLDGLLSRDDKHQTAASRHSALTGIAGIGLVLAEELFAPAPDWAAWLLL